MVRAVLFFIYTVSTMSLALYRKYRPSGFTEVLGQEHIVETLKGAIAQGHVAHAYLFAGSRGTGKTSLARILAREIGCTDKDLYEIDAASHTGVDDIREIREGVATLPFESPYKVYIIDETHMLSKAAFNALLKTLEEPPKHVVFILATTEAEKLPETIVSRCQTFTFRKPSRAVLTKMIGRVAKAEGFTLEPAAGDLVALLADGSFRDAHGILQKVMGASKDKKVSLAEVEIVTGAPRGALVNNILTALGAGDIATALGGVRKAADANTDVKVLIALLLEKMRAVLLLKFAPDMRKDVLAQFTDEDAVFLEKCAAEKGSRINSAALVALLDAYAATGRSAVPQLPLEIALIDLLAAKSTD